MRLPSTSSGSSSLDKSSLALTCMELVYISLSNTNSQKEFFRINVWLCILYIGCEMQPRRRALPSAQGCRCQEGLGIFQTCKGRRGGMGVPVPSPQGCRVTRHSASSAAGRGAAAWRRQWDKSRGIPCPFQHPCILGHSEGMVAFHQSPSAEPAVSLRSDREGISTCSLRHRWACGELGADTREAGGRLRGRFKSWELLASEDQGLCRAAGSLLTQRRLSCKKPIASEASRSLLVRPESVYRAMEKQIRYCNTREHKANLEVTCKRSQHQVSALFGALWCTKKDWEACRLFFFFFFLFSK